MSDVISTTFHWPKNPSIIGMTTSEVKNVSTFLNHIFSISSYKNQEFFFKRGQISYQDKKWKLARSIQSTTNGTIYVFLKNLTPLGKGRYCSVKSTWNLTEGKLLAKKRITNLAKQIYEKSKNIQGVSKTSSIIFRRSTIHNKLPLVLIQPIYDGTLQSFIHRKLITLKEIPSIVKDLTSGLDHLHRLKWMDHKTLIPLSINFFHNDIKPENILMKCKKNGVLKASLDDFGLSHSMTHLSGSPAFFSPEFAKFYFQRKQFFDYFTTREFYCRFGQAKDVWSLGLVLVYLLIGKRQQCGVIDIPALEFKVDENRHRNITSLFFKFLAQVTQEEIDRDIDTIKSQYSNTEYHQQIEKLCDLIKRMLQINPHSRIAAPEAAQLALTIISTND